MTCARLLGKGARAMPPPPRPRREPTSSAGDVVHPLPGRGSAYRTGVGEERSVVVPSPSCPALLSPQQETVPPGSRVMGQPSEPKPTPTLWGMENQTQSLVGRMENACDRVRASRALPGAV